VEPRLTDPFAAADQDPAPAPPADGGAQPWPDPADADRLASVHQLPGTLSPYEPPPLPEPAQPRLPNAAVVLARRWAADAAATAEHAIRDGAIWREQPPSLAGLVKEMQAANWAPEDARLLRDLGRAYRLLFAIPLSAVGYGLLAVAQRPMRLAVAVVVVGVALLFIVVLA
jgi:hypothetical protein